MLDSHDLTAVRRDIRKAPPQPDAHQRLTLHFAWRSLGAVTRGSDGRLRFPEVTASPGLFRLCVGAGTAMVQHVGESASLRRRFAALARAMPGGNGRSLAACLHRALSAGERVLLDIATGGVIEPLHGRARAACLADAMERRLFCQASCVELLQAGFAVEPA